MALHLYFDDVAADVLFVASTREQRIWMKEVFMALHKSSKRGLETSGNAGHG